MADIGDGGHTPWDTMTVETMQRLIQNPDTEKHWELLSGWRRSADLIDQHRSEVQKYRDNLAAAWPPGKSAAAAAYLARLDDLIANFTETYEAALANHDAFSSATVSIVFAQTEMDRIYQEYTSIEKALTPTGAAAGSPSAQAVVAGRQEELRLRAVALLTGVSADLAEAQFRLVKPTPYLQGDTKQDPTDRPRLVGDTSYAAPPIPPITPRPSGSEAQSSIPKKPAITLPPANDAPPFGTTTPATTPSGAEGRQPGLILGGISPPISSSTAEIASVQPSPPGAPAGPITNPGLLPQTSSRLAPGEGAAVVTPTTTRPGRSGLPHREVLLRSDVSGSSSTRAMPPGAMIGGMPGAGVGQRQAPKAGNRQINPIGGVIGGMERDGVSGRSPFTADHRSNFESTFGQPGGRNFGHRDRSEVPNWDPDNPWQTAEGVEPVVLPPREHRIDPGPVIGLH